MTRTLAELQDVWEARRQEHERLGSMAPVATICAEILRDLREVGRGDVDALTLRQASALGGYAPDSLQRMVASGQIENIGRKHKPLIRRTDVPIKPGHSLRTTATADQLSPRRRIVRSTLDHTQRSA